MSRKTPKTHQGPVDPEEAIREDLMRSAQRAMVKGGQRSDSAWHNWWIIFEAALRTQDHHRTAHLLMTSNVFRPDKMSLGMLAIVSVFVRKFSKRISHAAECLAEAVETLREEDELVIQHFDDAIALWSNSPPASQLQVVFVDENGKPVQDSAAFFTPAPSRRPSVGSQSSATPISDGSSGSDQSDEDSQSSDHSQSDEEEEFFPVGAPTAASMRSPSFQQSLAGSKRKGEEALERPAKPQCTPR